MLEIEVLARLRIGTPEDIRPAAMLLRDTVNRLCGLRTAVCHNISSSQPMRDAEGAVLASSVFGFAEESEAWWLHPHLALNSPLTAACRFEAEPFWCNARGIWTRHRNPALEMVDLSDFEARALTRSAIVVPIHLPLGQVAAASFLPPDPETDDLSAPFQGFSDLLAVYVRQFVSSYVQVTRQARPGGTRPSLTKREVECLRWAAMGKTNEEIATIMALARTTIRFHIRNASEKLNAVNRDQTVFKATQLGYLGTVP